MRKTSKTSPRRVMSGGLTKRTWVAVCPSTTLKERKERKKKGNLEGGTWEKSDDKESNTDPSKLRPGRTEWSWQREVRLQKRKNLMEER